MKNKKGFADPVTITVVAILIIGILIFGWFSSGERAKEKIKMEELKNQELEGQVYQSQIDLGEANRIIEQQNENINELNKEVIQLNNISGKFNLFWLTYVNIDQTWTIIINLALFSFSFVTIKFIFKVGKK